MALNKEKVAWIKRYQTWEVEIKYYPVSISRDRAMMLWNRVRDSMLEASELHHYIEGTMFYEHNENWLFIFRTRDSIAGFKDPKEDG